MRLGFFFQLQLSFSLPVHNHAFALRCLPRSDSRQQVIGAGLRVMPDCAVSVLEDGCGLKHYGTASAPHAGFAVQAEGIVDVCTDKPEDAPPRRLLGPFCCATPLTAPGPALRKLDGALRGRDVPDAVMALLADRFDYVPNSTGVGTAAEDAAQTLRGVCQDEAHIMLALLRMRGIPCRYVMGYMLGEGSTHAWVEAWDNGKWIAYDPTNHCAAGDSYIRIAVGRDASECTVNKGVFSGTGLQKSQSSLSVWGIFE